VVSQATSEPTNKENLIPNYQVLSGLLQHTPSLLLDADLEADSCVASFLNAILSPDDIRLVRYTHIALEGISVTAAECSHASDRSKTSTSS
jgi:hypothetical protein